MVAVLRLGATERGITEIMGAAEHTVSIAAAAAALRLRADLPERVASDRALIDASVTPPHESRRALDEIATWSNEILRVEHVPAFWRALARKPRLLEAVWARHRLVLGAGELGADLKLAVGLAVAANKASDYWTAYFSQWARTSLGFDDETFVEISGAVLHYTAFNTISHGMMLQAPHRDISAAAFAPEDGP